MLTKKTTKKCKDGCKADMYQSGGAANYLEQILGAVNQGNPFTPKNEKASLLGYDTWLKDNGYTSFWDKANKQKEYANYVASNKSFNEQLPLGPNFGGLFELNQMATDEQLNKKDTLADYTKSISTYAPQGFAEEGGMVDGQAANKFPSLQAIVAGLPKEMKAKDKQKVAANAELELQQILGYKDNSPFKNLPSIDIYSDTIDMNNVSTPLEATSNNGISKILQPNSGLHYFAGADVVREVPMAQQGGGTNVDGKKFIQDWINSPHFTDRLSKNLYELESKNFDNKYEGVLDKYIFQNDATSDAKKLKEEALSKLSGTKEYYGLQGIKDLIKANKISKDVAVDGFQTSSGFYHPYSKSIWLDSKDNDSTRAHESTHATNLDDVLKDLAPSSALYNKIKNEVGLEKDQSLKFRWDNLSVINKDNSVNKEKTKEVLGVLSDYGVSQEKMMYLERSKEIYPHLMQIRYDNNIKPGEVIDEEKMESIFQNSESNNNLFKTYSKKQIMQMLNKFATTGSKIPMNIAQNGGAQNRQMIFNLLKQKPMGRYADGGYSQSSPAYQYNLPVGNKAKVSGFIPLDGLIPIQTEKKELIVLPTFDVVPVNAKLRHSQMTDDQVTDIVPENSYILSQFGQVDIYRSEADEVIIETENKPYNLYGVNPEPRVKTLGDIMNKKVMKPADLGRALTTKYKQIDNAGDPYTEQTNMANKETLSKYLQALIGLSEMDKARKGIDNSMEAQMSQGQLPQMVAANGGTVMRSSNVPKASLGLIAAAGASLLTGAFNYFSNRSAQKKAAQNQAASLAEIAKWRNQQLGLSNTGLGIGMASVFAQDPTVDPVLQQSGFLDSMQKGLPQQFLDYQQSRNLANRPDFSGLGAQESNALNNQYYAQALNSQSALALQAARDRAAMFNQYLQAKGQIQNFNIASRTNATNATRVNANNMLSTAGGIGMGNITDRQNIETNALQSKLAANNNALQFSLNRMGAENQGYLNSLALGTQVYNSITANQPAVNQNNVQPRSTDQYQDPYGFNGTQGYGMSNYTSNPYDFTANAAPTGAGPLYSQNNPSDCILGRNIRTGLPC